MRKTRLILIAMTMTLVSVCAMGQEKSKERFGLGINSFIVSSKLRDFSNFGMGINGSYKFPIVKKIGLDATAMVGVDRLMNCGGGICKSEWFQQPFWLGIGLGKTFEFENQQALSLMVRSRRFGSNRNFAMLIDTDTGEVIQYSDTNFPQIMWGINIGYRIPGKLPIEIGLAIDSGTYHYMSTLSGTYRF